MFMKQPLELSKDIRLLFFSFLPIGLVLTACYSGSIHSQIIEPFESGRIDTLQELVTAQKDSRVILMTRNNTPIMRMIKVNSLILDTLSFN